MRVRHACGYWTTGNNDGNYKLEASLEEGNYPFGRSKGLKDSMIEGLGYEWGSGGAGSCLSNECDDNKKHYSSSDQLDDYSNSNIIKEEEEIGFPKLTEMLNTTSSMDLKHFNALSDKLLLNSTTHLYSNTPNMGITRGSYSFTHIYPTINISNFNQSSSHINIHSSHSHSHLLPSSPTSHHHPTFNHNLPSPLHHMQQPIHTSSCNNSSHPSHFTNVMAETKRPNALMESKASQSQTLPKKSRLESRSSCPPFKVRKEKLGDRIAALQQLVAPFGKTDTASVLMEAIGYIKFLQNQVETLSVPYMKSSGKQTNRAMQRVSSIEEGKEDTELDLRSRGLCLVPLSCMSYFTGDGASGGVWQQSDHFGGAT
ncbi:transcription factor bHLH110 isoform X2 [Senna tora]|uniref:Transcription factor bHLH110 isoform X2 n=1 Tax=Senna tora TaxID=362788 RepID=A0A834TB16_9FABA|nr:transcription factor bHLH110 isoform X2 [Senna tora]